MKNKVYKVLALMLSTALTLTTAVPASAGTRPEYNGVLPEYESISANDVQPKGETADSLDTQEEPAEPEPVFCPLQAGTDDFVQPEQEEMEDASEQETDSSDLFPKFILPDYAPSDIANEQAASTGDSELAQTIEKVFVPVTTDAFKRTATLKGIQGNPVAGDHYFMNCLMQTGFVQDVQAGKAVGGYKAHVYKGTTYYFTIPTGIAYETIRSCNAAGKTVSIEFLLQDDGMHTRLIDPESRVPGKAYYAPNMVTDSVKKEYEAFFDFLAKEFSAQDCHIDNWILGNEVNMGNSAICYHFNGGSKNSWVPKYTDFYKVVYNAVRTYTSSTRVSICLDHSWNDADEGRGIPARTFLNDFAKRVGKNVDWTISVHCYPAVLFETRIWEPSAIVGRKLNPANADAAFVDGANLHVMTKYVKKHYGSSHRIMLTEQGFSAYYGEKAQAAAFVYTYYAAKFSGMVDCVILHTTNEGDKLNFQPMALYAECYRRIDSGKASDAKWIDKKILPVIGKKSWSELMPDFKASVLAVNINKITAYVKNLYLCSLGREATETELDNMVTSLKSGRKTAASAAKGLVLSSRMKSRFSTKKDYVKAVYKALNGKEISSKELSQYMKQLKKGHTMKYVAKQMTEGKKFQTICKKAGMEAGTIKAKK